MLRHSQCVLSSFTLLSLIGALPPAASCSAETAFVATVNDASVEFRDGNVPVATYIFHDPQIPRPYFAHLHTPAGIQVSRNHPPVAGKDKADHPTYHPGVWLAFGDLNGEDYWRLKARVRHARLLHGPRGTPDQIAFAVENHYLSSDIPASIICREKCHYRLTRTVHGYLLEWDSLFFSDRSFYFGDQEEMGLGVRVATPLRVSSGDAQLPPATGTIFDSAGRQNGAQIWGQVANWIDYQGLLHGKPAGIALFCHPDNFRPTRFHARDYGFIAANPFSMQAFKLGDPIKTTISPGEQLRLRYGILLHEGINLTADHLHAVFRDYVERSNN